MKIIYMGTPGFAVTPLQSIYDAGHEIAAVVTQPDKQRGRGKMLQFSEVKKWAMEHAVHVLQPEKIKDNIEFRDFIMREKPDLCIVVAYGKILPPNLLEIPKYGFINLHASLLPKHRGAAPIQKSILDGDIETGVSIMRVEQELDSGAVFDAATTPILRKTAGELHDELSQIGAELLLKTISDFEKGKTEPIEQDSAYATYAKPIEKSDGKLDFSKTAAELERMVRAFDPWPGTFFDIGGDRYKVWSADVQHSAVPCEPGRILFSDKNGLGISTADGIFVVREIQAEGKKRMSVADFLRGRTIEISSKVE